MQFALAIVAVAVALIVWNLLGNFIAQLIYPTRAGDDDGRRFIYRFIFLLVMGAMALGVFGGGAALGYWTL